MALIDHKRERRLYEAAVADRNPNRYLDDLKEGFDKKQVNPRDFSLRKLFEEFVKDGSEVVNSWSGGTNSGVKLYEAGSEVNTAAFSNITQQVLSAMAIEGLTPEAMPFSALIPTFSTRFNGEKLPGVGDLGDVGAAVPEGRPYPNAGVGQNWVESPTTTKRGVIVPVTKEAIFFDQTGMVLEKCRGVGEALAIGKEKRAIDCVIDENVTTHRYKWRGTAYATYQTSTPWDNVSASSTLEDYTDINNVIQTFNGILDPMTGEPVVAQPTHLICAQETEWTAKRILNATALSIQIGGYPTSGNISKTTFGNLVPQLTLLSTALVAARMATDTSWYVGNPAKAFVFMENWPITVAQAPMNSELEFTSDIAFRFRASEMGAYFVREPRQMVKATVA